MKKYLSGGWSVIKNYLFAMIFFYIFFIGFYSKAALFSILIFIIMIPLVYGEMAHKAGVDKRKYGLARPYEGAIYGLLAVLPVIIIQLVISQLKLTIEGINFAVLQLNLIKGFSAPMLFLVKIFGYSNWWSYAISWGLLVIICFLGYFAGYKNFEISEKIRKLLGLQPRQRKPKNKNRR